MLVKLLLIIAIIVQTVAIVFAVRLVRTTKYNAIWILFIVGFLVLSVERYMQLIVLNGGEVPMDIFYTTGLMASIGLSIGVMYAHRLFQYIDHLTHQRTLTSRRILSTVLRTEEKARSRFSKDLHDGLGPLLSSAKMSLSAMEHTTSEQERAEIAHRSKEIIDEAIRSLREISNNLSPQILSDFGLERAVTSFINKSAAKVRFSSNLSGRRYDSDIEVIIYRVVCELINNSLKHSQCREMKLTLRERFDGEELELKYSDDGCGFDPEQALESGMGMGLSNISSRINSLNGELLFESKEGEGMRANISIKIN